MNSSSDARKKKTVVQESSPNAEQIPNFEPGLC